jgi:hypothetical protein
LIYTVLDAQEKSGSGGNIGISSRMTDKNISSPLRAHGWDPERIVFFEQ